MSNLLAAGKDWTRFLSTGAEVSQIVFVSCDSFSTSNRDIALSLINVSATFGGTSFGSVLQ